MVFFRMTGIYLYLAALDVLPLGGKGDKVGLPAAHLDSPTCHRLGTGAGIDRKLLVERLSSCCTPGRFHLPGLGTGPGLSQVAGSFFLLTLNLNLRVDCWSGLGRMEAPLSWIRGSSAYWWVPMAAMQFHLGEEDPLQFNVGTV